MGTDRIATEDEVTVTTRAPGEIRLDSDEHYADDYFQKPHPDVDRGLGLPTQMGGHIYQPAPMKHHTRVRGRMGAPIGAAVLGVLIGGFFLVNLWSLGEMDSRIWGVLALWGVSFFAVVWLLVRTP